MMFVFAALGEFVVVKVLDKQYQMNKNKAQELPRIIPVVSKVHLVPWKTRQNCYQELESLFGCQKHDVPAHVFEFLNDLVD